VATAATLLTGTGGFDGGVQAAVGLFGGTDASAPCVSRTCGEVADHVIRWQPVIARDGGRAAPGRHRWPVAGDYRRVDAALPRRFL
jgi:hypothetical protein